MAKLLNEEPKRDKNEKQRTWEIQTKVIYEDDYKTHAGYVVACNHVDNEWIFVTSDEGWNGHGGYSMWQKVEE